MKPVNECATKVLFCKISGAYEIVDDALMFAKLLDDYYTRGTFVSPVRNKIFGEKAEIRDDGDESQNIKGRGVV